MKISLKQVILITVCDVLIGIIMQNHILFIIFSKTVHVDLTIINLVNLWICYQKIKKRVIYNPSFQYFKYRYQIKNVIRLLMIYSKIK